MKFAIESLPSIVLVSVTKEYVGLNRNADGEVVSTVSSFFTTWSITFLNPNEKGFEPGHWDHCPANIGSVSSLTVYTSYLLATFPSLNLEVFEIRKGTPGNDLRDDIDVSNIGVSFLHESLHDVGIQSQEV